MEKLSAIIPTFNEEDNIRAAINSVSFADEIIVIDSFSTDNTVNVVKEYPNITLLQRVFDDFSSQKNYAIDLAKHNWIYILDADERISTSLKHEITTILKNPSDNIIGFYAKRTFYFANKKISYAGYQRDKVIRLFNKNFCKYNGNLVHEVIKANGKLGFFINKVDHYSYKNIRHFTQKLNHYASLQALELFKKNKKINCYHFIIKPIVRFFIHYIIRLGFLDGLRGLILSYLHSYAVFMRYAILLELKLNAKNKNK